MTDLASRIRTLSHEAFDLAARYNDTGESPPVERTARIRAELLALADEPEDMPDHEREGLRIAISEAVLDLNWIESGGILSTSIRLAAHRAGQPDSMG